MSKTIKKLNNLKNPESFLQINTVKGFKYIDRAGEIVNLYHNEMGNPPIFNMNLDGLTISKPTDKIEELKITAQVIWARFTKIDSLDMVSNVFIKEIEKILTVLEVEMVNRVGWRNYFIYNFQNKEKQKEYFDKLIKVDKLDLLTSTFEIKTGNKKTKGNMTIQPVVKKDDLNDTGVLFDVDIYSDEKIEKTKIKTNLKDYREYLSGEDEFLKLINQTFK